MHIYSLTSEVEKAWRKKRRVRSKAQLSLRKTANVVWPRYTERGRWVRCWLGEQLLFFGSDFSLYSNLRCEREKEGKLQSEPVGAWLKKYTYSLLMELFPRTWLQEYSTMPRVLGILRNILYPIWCSVGNSTHVEFSKSCRILKILSNSQNPIEFSKILSNILYPIEHSYGSSEDSTIYLTVSIAYSIYSTSQCAPMSTTNKTINSGMLNYGSTGSV